jgi:hypothetical protein
MDCFQTVSTAVYRYVGLLIVSDPVEHVSWFRVAVDGSTLWKVCSLNVNCTERWIYCCIAKWNIPSVVVLRFWISLWAPLIILHVSKV